MLELAVLTILPGAVAFAAAMDLLTMKIPNRVSALMVLAFFPLALLAGLGAWDILYHVAAGLAVLALGVLLFIPGWFGGGDAKLMAAIALWIGPDNLFPYIFWVAMAGGMIATVFSSVRSVPLPRAVARRGLGAAVAPPRCRHSLRHCAGSRRAARLSANDLVRQSRSLTPEARSGRAVLPVREHGRGVSIWAAG